MTLRAQNGWNAAGRYTWIFGTCSFDFLKQCCTCGSREGCQRLRPDYEVARWNHVFETDEIHATGAERVYATHGASGALTRYLRESGLDARGLHTEYGGEEAESGAESEAAS